MRTPGLALFTSLLIVAGCGGNSGDDAVTAAGDQTDQSSTGQVDNSSTAGNSETNQPVGTTDGQPGNSSCAVNLIPDNQRDTIAKAANLTFGPQQTLYFTDQRFSSLWQYTEDSGTSRLHADAHDYRNVLGVTSNAIYLTGRQFDGQPYALYELSLSDNTWRAVPGTEGVSVQLNAGTVIGETVFFFVKSVNAVDLWSYNQNDGAQAITTGEQLSGKTTVLNDALIFNTIHNSGYSSDRNYRYSLATGTVEQMEQLAIDDRFHLRAHSNGMSYRNWSDYTILDANGNTLSTTPFNTSHSSYAFDSNSNSIYTYRANTFSSTVRDGVYELNKLNLNGDATIVASAADRFGNLTLLDTGLYTVLKGTTGASLSHYTDTAGLTTIATFNDIDAKTDRQLADPLFTSANTLYFTAEDSQGWSLWAVDTSCH